MGNVAGLIPIKDPRVLLALCSANALLGCTSGITFLSGYLSQTQKEVQNDRINVLAMETLMN